MNRREFIAGLGSAAAWPMVARGQTFKNLPRLCFITFDPASSRSTRFEAFFQGLADLGYVDKKPSTSTTFPLRVTASGFRASLPNVFGSRRTSSP